MVKLVIFDLDGTLINSLNDLSVCVNYVLRRRGYPEHELSAYRYFVGNGVTKLIERALPKQERSVDNIESVKDEFIRYYSLHKTDFTVPYDGIMSMLKELKQKGILLAVASNKFHSATVELISYCFGEGFFDFVYGHRDGVAPKPDPTIVFDILREVGIDKSEALFVGDSGVDMQTALNGGVRSVGVTWGFRDREELLEEGACEIIDKPDELIIKVLSLRYGRD